MSEWHRPLYREQRAAGLRCIAWAFCARLLVVLRNAFFITTLFALTAFAGAELAAAKEIPTPKAAVDSWARSVAKGAAGDFVKGLGKEKGIDPAVRKFLDLKFKSDLKDIISDKLGDALRKKLDASGSMSPEMGEIMVGIANGLIYWYHDRKRTQCQKRALWQATAQFQPTAVSYGMDGTKKLAADLISIIFKLPGLVEGVMADRAAQFLTKKIFDKLRDYLNSALDNFLKKKFRIETYKMTFGATKDACPFEFHVVWNLDTNKFKYLFFGNCKCNPSPTPQNNERVKPKDHLGPLGRWSISGGGHRWLDRSKGIWRVSIGRPNVKADCTCAKKLKHDPWEFIKYTPFSRTRRYAMVVQTGDKCTATTYNILSTTVTEQGAITETGQGDVITTGPISGEPAPGAGEPAPGEGEPTPGEQPGVPECPKKKPPVIIQGPPESTPPTTVTETPKSPPPEKPDLGLVKAKEEVVTLAMKGEKTGKAYEGAAVKLLAAAPDIPTEGEKPDPALSSAKAYASDVTAGYSNKDGTVTLSLTSVAADDANNEDNKDNKKDEKTKPNASPAAGITLSEVKVDERPKGQLVITMMAADDDKDGAKKPAEKAAKGDSKEKSKDGSKEAPAKKMASKSKPKLPASLATPGSDLCVDHSFRIGNQVSYVARVAKSAMEEVKRRVEHTEGVYSVEEDPCRGKEAAETLPATGSAD